MKKYLVLLCVVFSLLMVQMAAADLVLNGSFEDPVSFNHWSVTEASPPDSYLVILQNTEHNQPAHSGNFAACFWGSADDTISQTIATVAGQAYTFSFWLYHPSHYRGNDFSAYWNGTAKLSLAADQDNSIAPYQQYSYTVTGTGSDTIQFSGHDDNYYYRLDDVSVTPLSAAATPIPPSALLLGSGLLGLAGLSRRKFSKS